ncbi:flagellar biosynthesis repressor FlbT [Salinarimonas ramus]|uniref:Flagellum biosynthesis repressor protein FlbT n=1 Tax=Salinarimonas ramus TaxID=690164 RepID=A0A917Q7B0_9HYPH|nr:flagellar biosynthesis repressor FlbT [Salinarimonas ramus]GGK33132.1 putative flagellum biosynthesis repressor protein FlbT [Salinarimonas ramus]
MSGTMRLTLRAGERVWINGAVVRAERKTTLEILNDATFLLESHVLQPEETTTPLRQIYFAVQTMFVDPSATETAQVLFERFLGAALRAFASPDILGGLMRVRDQMEAGRRLDAMKTLRALFPAEDAILAAASQRRDAA